VSDDQLTDDEPFLAPQVAEPLIAALGPLRGGRDGTFLCHNQSISATRCIGPTCGRNPKPNTMAALRAGHHPTARRVADRPGVPEGEPDEITASSSRTRSAPDRAAAAGVNGHDVIVERARACQRERGLTPNDIAVDFYNLGDLTGAVDTLDGGG
jgi:hypothetical protein